MTDRHEHRIKLGSEFYVEEVTVVAAYLSAN